MQEKGRKQGLLPRSMRKQRPPVAVRLEGAKDPKFHCLGYTGRGKVRRYHRCRHFDAFVRPPGFTRFLPGAASDERRSRRDDYRVPPASSPQSDRAVLTSGLRGQASSAAGAWQLEDNGYVLPRPRATAGSLSCLDATMNGISPGLIAGEGRNRTSRGVGGGRTSHSARLSARALNGSRAPVSAGTAQGAGRGRPPHAPGTGG
jgi:hypothetical protein